MNIYIIGNSIASGDDVPSRLIWGLEKAFPHAVIEPVDPSENFTPKEDSFLIDSVNGIDRVCVYEDINVFVTARSVSVHDYDVGLHLQLLNKLRRLPHIWIIGVPRFGGIDVVLSDVIREIRKIINTKMKT